MVVENPLIGPVSQVLGGIEGNRSGQVLLLGPYQHPPAIPSPDDLRVPVVLGEAGRRFHTFRQLEKAPPVFRNRGALAAGSDAVTLVAAGIEKVQLSILDHRAAGVDPVFILFPIGENGAALTLPADQVRGGKQAPFFIGVVQSKTVPLMEKVISPVELNQAVGVVQKALGRLDMI